MPFVSIATNENLTSEQSEILLTHLTELIVDKLNKPKEYVQVALSGGNSMQFAGSTAPTAFIELRAIGLTEDKTKRLSAALTELVVSSMGIPPNRVFLNLLDVPRTRWGWDSSTFG